MPARFRVSAPVGVLLLCALPVLLPACSGDGDGGPGTQPPVALAAITDLRAVAGSATSVTLSWTSPAVLAKADLNIRYDLRYTEIAAAATDWATWQHGPVPLSDSAAGVARTQVVAGLQAGVRYIFGLRASSDGSTWSAASHPVVATAAVDFDDMPPAAITDLQQWGGTETGLTLAWSESGDDGRYGEASAYELRYSEEPITAENWPQATLASGAPTAAVVPGMLQQTLTGLATGVAYHCAVFALDDEDQRSDLSNVPALTTRDLTVIRVFVDGSGDYPNIERAIGAADSGDVVLVGPGRYTWTNQGTGDALLGLINVPRDRDGFEVRSMAGAAATILDAEGHGGSVMSVTGGSFSEGGEIYDYAGITIDGFTLTGGSAMGQEASSTEGWAGGGIYLHLSDSIIRNCIITGNEATQGGGVWIGGQGDATLEDCLIKNNSSSAGGGVMLINSAPRITVRRCTIRNNNGSAGGGLLAYHCTVTVADCIITGNVGSSGGGIMAQNMNPGGEIIGCTIAGNSSPIRGSGLYVADGTVLTVARTVVAHNQTTAAFAGVANSWVEIGCSLVFGNAVSDALPFGSTDDGTNLLVDPLFCDLVAYRPSTESPCLPANRAPEDGCGLIGAVVDVCPMF